MNSSPKTLKEVFYKFCFYSTVRGVPRIVKEPKLIWKGIWFVAVCTFLGIASYFTARLVITYQEYPIRDVQKFNKKGHDFFPAITACNKIFDVKHLKSRIDSDLMQKHEDIETFLNNFTLKHKTDSSTSSMYRLLTLSTFLNESAFIKRNNKLFVTDCYYEFYGELTVKNVDCHKANKKFYPDHPNCITIEPQQESSIRYSKTTLKIHFYTNNTKPEKTAKGGVDIYLHKPGAHPIYAEGTEFRIPTGYEARWLVHTFIRQNLRTPKTKCFNTTRVKDSKNQTWWLDNRLCIRFCIQRYAAAHCNCTIPIFLVPGDARKVPTCFDKLKLDGNTEKELLCVDKALHEQGDICQQTCQSKPSCHQIVYERSLNRDTWPDDVLYFYKKYISKRNFSGRFYKYENVVKLTKEEKYDQAGDQLRNLYLVQQNFAKLVISQLDQDISYVEEKFLIPLSSLMSQVGGILSLWLGLSVMFGVELLELLYDIFLLMRSKIWQKMTQGSKRCKTRPEPDNSKTTAL